jgi:hypothetical protein
MRITSLLAVTTVALLVSTNAASAIYDFLPVAQTGTDTSQYTSNNFNGNIDVTDTFSSGGRGTQSNQNNLIFPSTFTNTFPGTGQVQGHLAITVYNHTSLVEFDLNNYNLSSSTVFGVWNMTNEVLAGPGGNPVYRLEVLDINFIPLPLTGINIFANQDNQTQVQGEQKLMLDLNTGEFYPGVPINGGINGPDTHTDAIFMDSFPTGTKYIRVYGDLPALNPIGDGVGYYFAELVPEPGTAGVLLLAGVAGLARRRR